MKKPSTWDKIKAMDSVGFTYHAYGTLTADGKKYDYYKGDTLTAAQKEKLKDRFGDSVRFFGSSAQYAPEIRGAVVGFLVGKSKVRINPRRKNRGLIGYKKGRIVFSKISRAVKLARSRRGKSKLRRTMNRRLKSGLQLKTLLRSRRNCGCSRKRSHR